MQVREKQHVPTVGGCSLLGNRSHTSGTIVMADYHLQKTGSCSLFPKLRVPVLQTVTYTALECLQKRAPISEKSTFKKQDVSVSMNFFLLFVLFSFS